MADTREDILTRIVDALSQAGGFSVKRMDVSFDGADLPAVMLFDGSESVQTKAPFSVTPMLVDMHPVPKKSLVDAQQAITLEELPYFLEDVAIAREAWEKRRALARKVLADLAKAA